MNEAKAKKTAAEIIELYKNFGSNEYAGEKVTQLEHMVQAATLAKQGGYDDEMILAAFLHDLGHICVASYNSNNNMGGYGVINHEKIGGQFLRNRGFSERIARLVENHVSAKRYLTFKFSDYYNGLSEASKKTLEYQGGRMNLDEAALFENDSFCEDFIKMRQWDEQAKEENIPLSLPFDYLYELMCNHLVQQNPVLSIA